MPPLPPNPLNLGGAPPADLAPKGKLALPPNPIGTALLSAPKVAPPKPLQAQRNQQNADFLAGVQQRKEQLQAHPVHGTLGGLAHTVQQGIKNTTGVNLHGLSHPLASLEGKGEFAAPTRTFDGKEVPFYAQPLPWFGGSKVLGGAAKVGRTSEEAAAHVLEASHNAVAEGHLPGGGGIGQVPKLKPGEVTPETGGEPGASVRAVLQGPDAKAALTAQKGLYARGRTEQVAKGLEAREAAGGGLAGHIAERAAQAGALPKIPFPNGLQELDQSTLEGLFRHAQSTVALKPFEQGNAVDALVKLSQGNLPTKSEQLLLSRTFGKEVADGLLSIPRDQWKTLAVDVLNVPRALMASADLSAPLRQGLFAVVSHPLMASKSFAPMMKAAFSEKYFQEGIMGSIHDSPYYPLAQKGGLAVTDIGKTPGGALSLGGREEQRMSNLAERIPAIGKVVRGSDRAYVGFLDKLRMDYFSRLVSDAARQGRDVNDEGLLTDIAKVVNQATGRGNVPKALQDHLATMNALFFAPRLMASRINMLNPVYYMRLDPFARREALRNFVAMGGTALSIIELAKLAGAQVNADPTNADFAKIKMGNIRIDFLGGEQQYIRIAAQLYKNKITSSTTGNVIPLGSGFAKTSRYDVVMKFLQGKLSPVPSLIVSTLQGKNYTGTPVKWSQLSTYERAAGNNMVPFLAQDLYSLYTTSGPDGLFAGPLDLFGVGVQSYKAKTPSNGNSGGWGSGGSGGSSGGWGGSSGGSSSGGWGG